MALAAICIMPSCMNNTTNGHEWVDLGLPSGTLWATCNVGAHSPEEYGDYFAWGETMPKDTYDMGTYIFKGGFFKELTKYCSDSNHGYNGFTDNLIVLQPSDDAATVNWGSDWSMPTKEQWRELVQNTSSIWTIQNGVNGRLFTANNGNTIFLPAAGGYWDNNLIGNGEIGNYLSSSLNTDYPYSTWYLIFRADDYDINCNGGYRFIGKPVRAVCYKR